MAITMFSDEGIKFYERMCEETPRLLQALAEEDPAIAMVIALTWGDIDDEGDDNGQAR
jgi:hypothetical protein